MSKVIDLTGQKFNRLLVIEPARTKSGKFAWKCKCDCGNYTITQGTELKNGRTKSCGCYAKDFARTKFTKHGLSNNKLRFVFNSMHARCENPNNNQYHNYGNRGVVVCNEWKAPDGFINFYNWAMSNGYAEGLQIDRIDNDGNYCPQNCRWVTPHENSLNKRVSLKTEYKGQVKTLMEFAEEFNIPYKTLFCRIKYLGWDIEKSLKQPIRK